MEFILMQVSQAGNHRQKMLSIQGEIFELVGDSIAGFDPHLRLPMLAVENMLKKINWAKYLLKNIYKEDTIIRRVGVEEELIKFRPSPNFKNMKKFLKSRSDYIETTTLANLQSASPAVEQHKATEPAEHKERKPPVPPPNEIVAPKPAVVQPHIKNMKKFLKSRSDYMETTTLANLQSASPAVEQHKATKPAEHKERKPPVPPPNEIVAPKPAVVQPPLPPYPPPKSPLLNVVIKQEREDEDDNQNHVSEEGESSNSETQQAVVKKQETEQNQARPKKTICKEFIRGNCQRPVCKYAHEIDVSQLEGIFTFCWNYQNGGCTYPNCRFVHASVFEEYAFLKTGVLPPHARSHLKRQHQQAQPPPPQPEEPLPPEVQTPNFANPPPQLPTRVELVDEFRTLLPRSGSPLKRDWASIENFNTSPRELEPNEHMAKKCKNCEIMEISLKYNREEVEKKLHLSAEIDKKIGIINKKNTKLYNVLFTLLKSSNKLPLSNGLISGGEKDQLMLDQIKSFVSSNRSYSGLINDDGLKNLVGGNATSFMAKLLCSAGESTLQTDLSRET